MAGDLSHLRGTTAQLNVYAGPAAEFVVDTDDNAVHIQDGVNLGGWIVGGHRTSHRTTTVETIGAADQDKLVTFQNGGATAVTLVQAIPANNFQDGAKVLVYNIGAGTVTITPTGCVIWVSGVSSASMVLTTGQGAIIISGGVNYFAMRTS